MATPREFQFQSQDFERIRQLIHAHAGIALSEAKNEMVYSRVTRRLRATGLKTFGDYLIRLECDPGEFEQFVNSLTTNLTAFFRENHHFPILATLVQELAAAGQFVSLWSAACSTGEEAYSIAITAIEALGTYTPPVKILGTDLDTRAVRTADLGIYPVETVEKLSTERLKRFFLRGTGQKSGYVRVRPEVRALVRFRPMNLVTPQWPVRGPFHAVFCRNAMIYFDRPMQRRIIERLAPLLHPRGKLFTGHAESLTHSADLLTALGQTVYAPVSTDPGPP